MIETVGRNLRLKSFVGAFICHPWMGNVIGRIFGGKIPHKGSRIEVGTGNDPRVNAYLLWGLYESAEIRFIETYLNPDSDVIELGSSIGGVACVIAKKLAVGRQLICVEANPKAAAILRVNLNRNAPHSKVFIVEAAVSYGETTNVEFGVGESNLNSRLGQGGATISVSATTLASLADAHDISSFALVCDIEGAEVALFQNDGDALKRCHTIVIELHVIRYQERNFEPDDIIDLIVARTGMILLARYSEVCVFTRAATSPASSQS